MTSPAPPRPPFPGNSGPSVPDPFLSSTVSEIAFRASADRSTQHYLLLDPGLPAVRQGTHHRPGGDATARDIVIALHGHGTDRRQFAFDPRDECRAFRQFLVERGMLGVCPDYRAPTSWMGPVAESDMLDILADLHRTCPIRRIFWTGGSMGGTAALTFAVLHPEHVHGVAAFNPLANHLEFENFQDAISEAFGARKEEDPREYIARSAELQVHRLTMPVALTVGGQDRTIPPDSARRLAAALRRLGRPVLLLDRPDTGHTTSFEDALAALHFLTAPAPS